MSKRLFGKLEKVGVKISPSAFVRFMVSTGLYKKVTAYGGFSFDVLMEQGLKNNLTRDELADTGIRKRLIKDALLCHYRYGMNPQEYFLHDFRNKDESVRESYLPKSLKDEAIMTQLGDMMDTAFYDLKDKYKFYTLAGRYFKRDVCGINRENDFEHFVEFASKHRTFIAKPIKGRFGENTAIYNTSDYQSLRQLYDKLLSITDEWIVEELIEQDERMKVWNPTSVNTVRLPSFRTKDGIAVLAPFMRMGRKGSVVDNAGSGGVMISLDVETGEFCTEAMDEDGKSYTTHPDSGKPFKGWRVPEWDVLMRLSKEVHQSLPPYHKYVGFDFALSKNGWVLVEGNWGDFICQQATRHRGMKKEFMAMING